MYGPFFVAKPYPQGEGEVRRQLDCREWLTDVLWGQVDVSLSACMEGF
jgi:hypothetical protein